jgi:hypothetical protein
MQLEGLGKLIKFNYFIGSRISDSPACCLVSKPLRECVLLYIYIYIYISRARARVYITIESHGTA